MAVATRFVLRASVLLAVAALLPSPLHAQEGDPPADADYTGVLARSNNRFAFQFISELYAVPASATLTDLLPRAPKKAILAQGPVLTGDLARVPEVELCDPIAATDATKARKELLRHITHIRHVNGKRDDAFIEALVEHRVDLSGLPFLLGDACRLDEERVPHFQAALDQIRGNVVFADTGPNAPKHLFAAYRNACIEEDAKLTTSERVRHVIPSRVSLLMQIEGSQSAYDRQGLAEHLAELSHTDSTRALARLALFSAERDVREAAIDGLRTRRERDYTTILLHGLRYPWPEIARRAAEALVQLECDHVVPRLVDLLDLPNPRDPVIQLVKGNEVTVVRELVKVNHLRNCLLCHAPAALPNPTDPPRLAVASIPIPGDVPPSQGQFGYGFGQQVPEDRITLMERERLNVRIDITYLRQDFSAMLNVPGEGNQRFDFLVRTRVVSEKEAEIFRDKLAKRGPGAVTPYERAILYALRELTGRDTEPTAAAWRKLLASR